MFIQYTQITLTSHSSYIRSPSLLPLPKEKYIKSNLYCPYTHWSKLPGSPLKKTESFPRPLTHPNPQKSSAVKNCSQHLYHHFQGLSSTASFLDCYFCLPLVEGIVTEAFSVSHSQLWVRVHSCWRQHRIQASAWLPAAAQTTDINMATGCSPDHRHPHGLRWQHGSWTSTLTFNS